MSAIALPIITAGGRLVAAMGIGAINDRMSAARIEEELVPMLREEVGLLVEKVSILEKEELF